MALFPPKSENYTNAIISSIVENKILQIVFDTKVFPFTFGRQQKMMEIWPFPRPPTNVKITTMMAWWGKPHSIFKFILSVKTPIKKS